MTRPTLAYARRSGPGISALTPGWQVLTESQGRQSGQLSERYYINLSVEFIAPYALLFSLTPELTSDPLTDSQSRRVGKGYSAKQSGAVEEKEKWVKGRVNSDEGE